MPELPEVETVMRGIAPAMEGAILAKVEVRRPDLRWPFPNQMQLRLQGARVLRLHRRSKYILAELDTGDSWLIHLGMSGRITVSGDPLGQFTHTHAAAQKHDHVVWQMDNGAQLVFNDPRRFGAMDLIPTNALADHKLLASLGPEPLSNAFNEPYLVDALRAKHSPLKAALLDQKLVAGLGNIYVCEALFRAGLSPRRKGSATAPDRLRPLAGIIRDVLQDAITAGGSSLKDYRQASGDLGYFQHSFDVYGREGDPCRRAGCDGTIARIIQSGRSTFFCPKCQR